VTANYDYRLHGPSLYTSKKIAEGDNRFKSLIHSEREDSKDYQDKFRDGLHSKLLS